MAFQEYDVTTSIQKMTARQLRLYIKRGAEEANRRIESSKDIPLYMQDIITDERLKGHISKDGTFLKGTSFMDKQQMQDYAKQLRDFNFMDTSSKYAKDTEYRENKEKYENFIKEQIKFAEGSYWKKYIGKNGRVLKKGYEEYKEYINMVKNLLPYLESYGYGSLKKYFRESKSDEDPNRTKIVERLLVSTYEKYSGKGLDSGQLNDKFFQELQAYDEKQAELKKMNEKKQAAKKPAMPKTKKPKKSKSKGNTIKSKTGKKMKGETIRERQGTS